MLPTRLGTSVNVVFVSRRLEVGHKCEQLPRNPPAIELPTGGPSTSDCPIQWLPNPPLILTPSRVISTQPPKWGATLVVTGITTVYSTAGKVRPSLAIAAYLTVHQSFIRGYEDSTSDYQSHV